MFSYYLFLLSVLFSVIFPYQTIFTLLLCMLCFFPSAQSYFYPYCTYSYSGFFNPFMVIYAALRSNPMPYAYLSYLIGNTLCPIFFVYKRSCILQILSFNITWLRAKLINLTQHRTLIQSNLEHHNQILIIFVVTQISLQRIGLRSSTQRTNWSTLLYTSQVFFHQKIKRNKILKLLS